MTENQIAVALPGLDCGLCGSRTCDAFARKVAVSPELIKRCIMLEANGDQGAAPRAREPAACGAGDQLASGCRDCSAAGRRDDEPAPSGGAWRDSLGREFDFYLEHLPEDPGPREVMLPHNPLLTREMEIRPGDVLIGRPLGMSCGCPITHCGVVTEVDPRTGVIVWCVTGPLRPRQEGFKDIGYYSAEAYEGIVTETNATLRIGCRYYFQPRLCMLQWRHSGLVNFINRTPQGIRIRLEGLWIG
jgi:uncharacterized Fe-S cluster-containing protein